MMIVRKFALWFVLALLLIQVAGDFPRTVSAQQRPSTARWWYINPVVLSATPTDICNLPGNPPTCGATIWMCEADENASTGTAVSTTIVDGNGRYYWNTVAPLSATAASQVVIFMAGGDAGCRVFPKGMTVSASSGSTVTFTASGRY